MSEGGVALLEHDVGPESETVVVNNHLTEHEDVSAMEKIKEPLGTNLGGVFLDHKTGEHLYVKQYRDPAQASCEFIANKVLSRIGAPVLEGALVPDGDTVAYATPFHDDFNKLPAGKRGRAQDYFVAAAYLMDSDMVGIGPENPFGNLQEDEKGNLVLVDHGAALLFHGLMGRKTKDMLVSHDIAELRDMRNSEINSKSAQIFGGISQEELAIQAGEIVNAITPDFIEAVIAESKLSKKDANQVRTLLLGRRKVLEHIVRMNRPRDHAPFRTRTEKLTAIEAQIHESEHALGLNTESDKLIEASLFIDKKFLNYALITGVVEKPERVFGDKAWADYLDGRVFARQYGKQELTTEFIIDLQKKLTHESDSTRSGILRDVEAIGSSYDDPDKPVTYTPEQIRALESNPKLTFKRVPPEDETSTTGFIVYPHTESGKQTQEAILKDLEEICEWFNNAKKQDSYNPHIVAGLLQHRLISLHPFFDSNGGLSRALMNWSLENDGQTPSVIDNPGEDILTDEETWISYISKGSAQYKEFKQTQRALEEVGIENNNALFGLGQDKAFYDYIFKYLKKAPPLPTNGDRHSHQLYENFLSEFMGEMNGFQEYMRGTSHLETSEGDHELSHGGLITPEFMQFATSPAAQVRSSELRKQFFTDTEVYRGGIIDGEIDDAKICQMFQQYIGVGTGYRALEKSNLPATSSQRISLQVIQESMDYYNKIFASTYFGDKHAEIPNPYDDMSPPVRDLNETIQDHVSGQESIWNSPFASTSMLYSIAKTFAKGFYGSHAKNAEHGILFKSLLPREGLVITHGKNFAGLTARGMAHEQEALVTGALQPAAMTGIELYDRVRGGRNPSLSASRVEEDGKVSVVIEDRRGAYVVERIYDYNTGTNRFEFASEATTEVPTDTAVKEPPGFDETTASFEQDVTSLIGNLTKEYITPFKSIKKKYLAMMTKMSGGGHGGEMEGNDIVVDKPNHHYLDDYYDFGGSYKSYDPYPSPNEPTMEAPYEPTLGPSHVSPLHTGEGKSLTFKSNLKVNVPEMPLKSSEYEYMEEILKKLEKEK